MVKKTKKARRKPKAVTPAGFPAHKIDVLVGANIRHFRRLAEITQTELGVKIGVKFQQVQKYEVAQNRVSASRLWMIAETLDIDVGEFFK